MPEFKESQKRRCYSRKANDSLPTPTRKGSSKCQRPVISAEQWITNNLVKCGRLSCKPGQTVVLELKEESGENTAAGGEDKKHLHQNVSSVTLTPKKFSTESICENPVAESSSIVADGTIFVENSSSHFPAKNEQTNNVAAEVAESNHVKDGAQSESSGNSDSEFVKTLQIEFDQTTTMEHVDESHKPKEHNDTSNNCIVSNDTLSSNMSDNQHSTSEQVHGLAQHTSNEHAQAMKTAKRRQHRRSSSLQLTRRMSYDLSTIPEESDSKRQSSKDSCSSMESLRFDFRNTLPRAASLGMFGNYDNWAVAVDKRPSSTKNSKESNHLNDEDSVDKLSTQSPHCPFNKPLVETTPNDRIANHSSTGRSTVTSNVADRRNNKPIVPAKPKKSHSNFKKLKEAKEHIRKSVNRTKKQTDSDTKSQQLGGNLNEGNKHSNTKHDKESHAKRKVFHTKKARDASRVCSRNYTTQTSSENEIETKDEKVKKSISGHRASSKYSRGVELFKTFRDKTTSNNDNDIFVKDRNGVSDAIVPDRRGINSSIIKTKNVHTDERVSTDGDDRLKTFDVKNAYIDCNGSPDKTNPQYDIRGEVSLQVEPVNHESVETAIKKPIIRCESSESDYSVYHKEASNRDPSKKGLSASDEITITNETDMLPERNGYFADTELVDYKQEERADDEVITSATQFGNLNLNQQYCAEMVAINHHPRVIPNDGPSGSIMTIHDESPLSDVDYFLNSSEKESEVESSSLQERTDMTDDDTSDVKTDILSTSMTSFTEDTSSSSSDKQSAESLDALTVKLDWKRRGYSLKRQDSEEGREWKERETRMTEKIQWLRAEITEMKKQDQSLMRQFLQLRSTIHAMKRNQDNASSNPDNAQSCDFLEIPGSTDNLSNGLMCDFALFGSTSSINNSAALSHLCSNTSINGDQNGNLTDIDGTIEYLPEFRSRTVSLVHGSRSEVHFVKPRTMTFSSGSKHDRGVFETSTKEIVC